MTHAPRICSRPTCNSLSGTKPAPSSAAATIRISTPADGGPSDTNVDVASAVSALADPLAAPRACVVGDGTSWQERALKLALSTCTAAWGPAYSRAYVMHVAVSAIPKAGTITDGGSRVRARKALHASVVTCSPAFISWRTHVRSPTASRAAAPPARSAAATSLKPKLGAHECVTRCAAIVRSQTRGSATTSSVGI